MIQFHQFDPIIYPRIIWIGVGIDIKDVKTRFDLLNANDEETIKNKGYRAIGFKVQERETNLLGVLLILKNKKIEIGTIAHESVHIADYIFEEIGAYSQDFSNKDEPYAYLVGWAAKCINDVRIYKK